MVKIIVIYVANLVIMHNNVVLEITINYNKVILHQLLMRMEMFL